MPPSEPSSLSTLEAVRQEELAQMRHTLATTWLARWQRMIDQWLDPADEPADGAWLMHAANYLFRTGGVRWAVDPVQLHWMLPEAPAVDVTELGALNLVLLTHDHKDHADLSLWRGLADASIDWVVPSFLRDVFIEATGVDDQRLIVAEPGVLIRRHGLEILPLTGLHWERRPDQSVSRRGIDALAYRVCWKRLDHAGRRTVLLPGDTRHYDAASLQAGAASDVLFAHVWLGRECALQAQPPMLEAMTRFLLELHPRQRVVLAHLYETTRLPADCWTVQHADLVTQILMKERRDLQIVAPMLGDRIEL